MAGKIIQAGPRITSWSLADKATWNLFRISVDDDVSAHYIVEIPGTPQIWEIRAKEAPTGRDFIADVIQFRPGGGGFSLSIFGTVKLVIPDGSTDTQTQLVFAPDVHFNVGDILKMNITQIGDTDTGNAITVVGKWRVD